MSVIPSYLFAYLSVCLLVWRDYTQAVQAWRRAIVGPWRDCSGLISILNEFSSPSQDFEPRQWRSTAHTGVIVSGSWQTPSTCLAWHNHKQGEEGEQKVRRRDSWRERERARFGGKQWETTGAAGRELVSSADYQSKSAFVSTSWSRSHTLTKQLVGAPQRQEHSNESFKRTKILWDFPCHVKYNVRQNVFKWVPDSRC